MRPMLIPGLRWAWRSHDSVRFGIDVPSPLIVSGLPAVSHALLSQLDGVQTLAEILTQLAADGADSTAGAEPAAVVERLSGLGLIVDGGSWPGRLDLSPAARERLLPDIRSASALPRWRAEPADRWSALASAQVTIVGVSRLGAVVARGLAAAGVGRVQLNDRGVVSPGDVSIGGFAPADVGRPRSELLVAHPEWAVGRPPRSPDQQLTVVTDAAETYLRCRALAAAGTAHLVLSCRELVGRVGPLVEPNAPPCHFCIELARRDLDPGWANVWRQQAPHPTPDADAVLVAITANIAVAHTVDWLTEGRPPSIGGFVDVVAPHGATTHRQIRQHPECGCAWPGAREP